jgi:Ca-activated chloride channel family protein
MGNPSPHGNGSVSITLQARPERRLIRTSGSMRHVDFHLQVGQPPSGDQRERRPVSLALVLDRSGSMQGEKLRMAKRAALAVVDRLEERDRAAVVVFDTQIDVVQPAESVTAAFKARVRAALEPIEARASTALHEGWLTGCKAIADDQPHGGERGLARCFLLTDGLANVGMVDPEQIAAEAANIREHAGIGTSTFGIGDDYNESLLGPMAVAGAGTFYHLRTAEEIARMFRVELGELLDVAAPRVALEVEADAGVTAQVVGAYQASQGGAPEGQAGRWRVAIGDLLSGEERHVVVRFSLPAQVVGQASRVVRARLTWAAEGAGAQTEWREVGFDYASHDACDGEPADADVLHWVGLAHADAAKLEAVRLSRLGDLAGARRTLQGVSGRIAEYAGTDDALRQEVRELGALYTNLEVAPFAPAMAKELRYQSQTRATGKCDKRVGP